MKYAVVRVDADYELIEGVECMTVFDTREEADYRLQQMKDQRDVSWKAWCDYITLFVDKIETPSTDYHGWVEFLKQFGQFGARYIYQKDFKRELTSYLIKGYSYVGPNKDDYNPPQVIRNWNDLFVVEIK